MWGKKREEKPMAWVWGEKTGREEWNASGKTHDVVTPGVEESKRKNDRESCQNILTRKLVICYI